MPSVVGLEVSTKERFGFNITSLVQKWHNQQFNNGLAIRSLYGGDPFTVYGEDAGAPEENAMLSVSYYYTQPNIINDTFYIRNVVNKKFLEAIVTENSTSVTPTLEYFRASMAQRWNIVNLHNGYFRIEDEAKGHVLTACGNTASSGVAVQPANANIAAYQQWRLIPKDGGYTIASRASYDANTSLTNTLCIAAESTESQPTVGLASNLDATTTNEVWNLLDVDSTNFVRVQVYYDHAYVSRYGGSSSVENTRVETVRSQLYNYMYALYEKYQSEFSIYIDFEITETVTACYACLPGLNCYFNHESICMMHGDYRHCAEKHHSNLYNIVGYLMQEYGWSRENDGIVKIFFIGHRYCVSGQDEEGEPTHDLTMKTAGLTAPADGIAVICDRTSYEDDEVETLEQLLNNELMVLTHEFGHFFNAEDHYDTGNDIDETLSTSEINSKYGVNWYNDDCIYGGHYRSDIVVNARLICEGCQRKIISNANLYSD